MFYSDKLIESTNYSELSRVILKTTGLYTPEISIIKFLCQKPFNFKNQDIFDNIKKEIALTNEERKKLFYISSFNKLNQLRKFLKGEISEFDEDNLNSILKNEKEGMKYAVYELIESEIEILNSSPQYKILKDIYHSGEIDIANIFPVVLRIKKDLTYFCGLKEYNNEEINWYINSDIIKDLSIYENDILLDIFKCIKNNNENLYDFDFLSPEIIKTFKAKKIETSRELNYKELINSRSEYEANYYRIWKQEIKNKFTIFKISNTQNALPYSVKFNNQDLTIIYEQKIVIDDKGNIYYVSVKEELEEILINIINKNDF